MECNSISIELSQRALSAAQKQTPKLDLLSTARPPSATWKNHGESHEQSTAMHRVKDASTAACTGPHANRRIGSKFGLGLYSDWIYIRIGSKLGTACQPPHAVHTTEPTHS